MYRGFRLYGILKIVKRTTISNGKLLEPDPCIWNYKVNTNRVTINVGDSLRCLDAVLLQCYINPSYYIYDDDCISFSEIIHTYLLE